MPPRSAEAAHFPAASVAKALTIQSWAVSSVRRFVGSESSTRPISQRNEDRSITALVGDYAPVVDATAEAHAATLDYVRAEVGQTSVPLYSYFALVADDPSVQVVSDANAPLGRKRTMSPPPANSKSLSTVNSSS